MYSRKLLTDFVTQSNLIEGIKRTPTQAELDAHCVFLALTEVKIADLEAFVDVIAPGKPLRRVAGMRVRVGNHFPPHGGPDLVLQLERLLGRANSTCTDPHRTHCEYEDLHPFMDGNGRSGRVLWLWMQHGHPLPPLLFLHRFYYDTLASYRG